MGRTHILKRRLVSSTPHKFLTDTVYTEGVSQIERNIKRGSMLQKILIAVNLFGIKDMEFKLSF